MLALLKDLTSDDLYARLAHLGVTPRLARQLQAAVIRTGAIPAGIPETSDRVLAAVRRQTEVPRLALLERLVSARDGFAKYRFRGDGAEPFEAVRIPLLHRPDAPKYVVCVSSQVGCALGCRFCVTGRLGFLRDLATWEIVDQVLQVRADSEHPIGGIVFMGMGEPLLNYDAVMRAARIFCEPCGLAVAAKAITVSTAGLVPGVRRFTAERQPYRLVVSLSFADPVQRREWMPVEATHPTADLMQALREYHQASGRRVTLAWTLVSGVNTGEEDARRLADLTRGLPVKLDLIDVNDPSGRLVPPGPAELNAFRDALRRHLAAPVARRYSGGQDIGAACGLLAGHADSAPR